MTPASRVKGGRRLSRWYHAPGTVLISSPWQLPFPLTPTHWWRSFHPHFTRRETETPQIIKCSWASSTSLQSSLLGDLFPGSLMTEALGLRGRLGWWQRRDTGAPHTQITQNLWGDSRSWRKRSPWLPRVPWMRGWGLNWAPKKGCNQPPFRERLWSAWLMPFGS